MFTDLNTILKRFLTYCETYGLILVVKKTGEPYNTARIVNEYVGYKLRENDKG